jgi:ribosomal protein S17
MIRTLRGTVVSDKMDKTVVVAVHTVKEHPIYRKKYKVTTKFKAHDAETLATPATSLKSPKPGR